MTRQTSIQTLDWIVAVQTNDWSLSSPDYCFMPFSDNRVALTR